MGRTFAHFDRLFLVEASGPAIRRPGEVSDQTLAALEQGAGLRVDPMY